MSYFDDNQDRIIYGRKSIARKSEPGSALARARQEAHRVFDASWQNGKITRTEAYRQLSERLGLKVQECHIGYFDIETCRKVVAMYVADDFEVIP